MSKRRKYSPEFKQEAVALTCQPGVSCRQVALEIGINPNLLSRWKREAGATAFVTSHEFTRRIVRGVDLRATYDFYDPDRDRETGARTRAGIGIDTLPYPYLGVLAMLNYHDYDEGIDVTGDDRVQANLVLHFLY